MDESSHHKGQGSLISLKIIRFFFNHIGWSWIITLQGSLQSLSYLIHCSNMIYRYFLCSKTLYFHHRLLNIITLLTFFKITVSQIKLVNLTSKHTIVTCCYMWGILSQLYRYIPVLHGRLLAILEQKYMINTFHQKNLKGAWLSEETAENLLPNSAKQYM